MNANEMKKAARNSTVEIILPALESVDAVQFADASWAILREVDGQEIWCEVTVKTKAYTDTQRGPAFDPFVAAEDWKADNDLKTAKAAEKAAAKEKKSPPTRRNAKRKRRSNPPQFHLDVKHPKRNLDISFYS